jgi:membrane associated rhomboid family serine protease
VPEPDLFVVCKNCGSEVSPYVTECPYCGQRVRRRAPEIGSQDPYEEDRPEPPRRGKRARRPRDREHFVAPETRPVATIGIIAIFVLAALALSTGGLSILDASLVTAPSDQEWWLGLTTLLVMPNLLYLFVTMLVVGIFGTHLERRFGFLAPVLVFLICGAVGSAAVMAAGSYPALGANGAALGLLVAWLVEDRMAAARGDDRENDMVGVVVLAATVGLVPLADDTASFVAAAGGAGAGLVLGLILSLFRR